MDKLLKPLPNLSRESESRLVARPTGGRIWFCKAFSTLLESQPDWPLARIPLGGSSPAPGRSGLRYNLLKPESKNAGRRRTRMANEGTG